MANTVDPRSLKAPDASQLNEYNKPMPAPVDPGRWVGEVGDEFGYEDHEGYLRVVVNDIKLQDAPEDRDSHIRFTRCSAKPRERGRMAGTSRLTDFLLAAGVSDEELRKGLEGGEVVELIESTTGSYVEFQLEWDAYDSERKEPLANSYNDFPDDPAGDGKLPYMAPDYSNEELAVLVQEAEEDEEKAKELANVRKVPARARIIYFVRPRNK